MNIRRKLLKFDAKINIPIVKLTNNRPYLFSIYSHIILPLRIWLFYAVDGMHNPVIGKESLDYFFKKCAEKLHNEEELKRREKELVGVYILYGIWPIEFYLFEFENKTHDERRTYLSDKERLLGCGRVMSWKVFHDLREKDSFYHLTAPFFKRDVCIIKSIKDKDSFIEFVKKQPIFFAKPLKGTLGKGCKIVDISSWNSYDEAFAEFLSQGDWILEEKIKQDDKMAVWNKSSINTVRVTSFLNKKDERVVLQPIIRAGREGAIIDNSGAGGLFAVYDPKTGIVITDGVDEMGNNVEVHPDSKIKFKGWQIPQYEELIKLSEEVHRSLGKQHRYIGFDFALSDRGWVLVEGNWGQFFSQMALKQGIRYQFEELLGLPLDTNIPM